MASQSMPAAVARYVIVLAVLSATSFAGEKPAKLGDDRSIFIGIGAIGKRGYVVQLDAQGKELGRVELESRAFCLAGLHDARCFSAVESVVPSAARLL